MTTLSEIKISALKQLFTTKSGTLALTFTGEIFLLFTYSADQHTEGVTLNDIKSTYTKLYPEKRTFSTHQRQNALHILRNTGLISDTGESNNNNLRINNKNLKVYMKAIAHMQTVGSSDKVKQELERKAGQQIAISSRELLNQGLSSHDEGTLPPILSQLKELVDMVNVLNNPKSKCIISILSQQELHKNDALPDSERKYYGLTVLDILTSDVRQEEVGLQEETVRKQLQLLENHGCIHHRGTHQYYYNLTTEAEEIMKKFMQIFEELDTL